MVGPDEIRRISSFTGMEWDEIAVPFPDIITTGDGCQFTFGWSVRRKEKECIFLYRNRCSIYEVRPRICSTYPFMLEEGEIRTFPCNGLMHPIEKKAAMDLAERLQDRYNKESEEDRKMKENYIMYPVIAKKFCIIDAEGRKVR